MLPNGVVKRELIRVGPREDFDEQFTFEGFAPDQGFFGNRNTSQAPRPQQKPTTRDQSTRPSSKQSETFRPQAQQKPPTPSFSNQPPGPTAASQKPSAKAQAFTANSSKPQQRAAQPSAGTFQVNRSQKRTAA